MKTHKDFIILCLCLALIGMAGYKAPQPDRCKIDMSILEVSQ